MHIQMERLYKAAEELKGIKTQAELARALNQSSQTIKNWEYRGISRSGMFKAEAEIGCSVTWLETGTGEMSAVRSSAPEAAPTLAYDSPFIDEQGVVPGAMPVRVGEDPDSVAIPRVKLRLRAGVAQYDTEPDMGGDGVERVPLSILATLQLDHRNLLAVRVRGMSMEPMMFEDDVVVIDTSDRKPINRELYALNFDGEALVKQMLYRGGQWYLHSINPDFGPVNVRSGQCSIVGRVVFQPGRVLTGRL